MFGKAGGRRGAPFAAAAWVGATAVASGVAWLGVDSVLIPAAETPPAVLTAAAPMSPALTITSLPPVPPPSPSPSAAHPPVGTHPISGPSHTAPPSPSASTSPSTTPSPSPSLSPSASPTATLNRYDTAGGVVVLAIGAHSASLVSATPAAGYSVQNWSATGWLRVDFNEGSTTYSVFATWNGYSPQVQVVGPTPGA